MTMVMFNDRECTCVIKGHSGYSNKGSDIVCAGISSITDYLGLLLQDGIVIEREPIPRKELRFRNNETKLYNSLKTYMIELSMIYPKYVEVTYD